MKAKAGRRGGQIKRNTNSGPHGGTGGLLANRRLKDSVVLTYAEALAGKRRFARERACENL
jgi:hypothetical protein